MLYRGRVQPRRRTPVLGIAVVVIGAVLVAGVGYALFRVLFAPRPKIVLAQPFATVGRNAPLVLDIAEHRYGVRAVKEIGTVRMPSRLDRYRAAPPGEAGDVEPGAPLT